MTGELHEYLVSWRIQTDAPNPIAAAAEALDIMRDPNSEALVFEVTDPATDTTVEVDLDCVEPAAERGA